MQEATKEQRSIPLDQLLLDTSNPRFGSISKAERTQRDVFDHIVENFGIDDLLSSLAVNGYFHAEPLVVRPVADGKYVVVEGNRRLAACLLLMGDDRARTHEERAAKFRVIWADHGKPSLDPLPVIEFAGGQDGRELLSYLGVRHIASSKSWDSFAKAAWVARVVDESKMEIRDVATMIGDQHRTIERLLQGFYLVQQLIETSTFIPEDSQKKGRGSVTDYPFSWIYTILGYRSAQEYLRITDTPLKPNPLQPENLSRGKTLVRAMFGDRSAGRSSAVNDSRQLGELAAIVNDPEKLSLLEAGKSVDQITAATLPIEDHLRAGIAQVRESVAGMIQRLSEGDVPGPIAATFIEPAGKARNSCVALEEALKAAAAKG